MELLGLDIPKWEGPTICESSMTTSELTTDIKPPFTVANKAGVKREVKREERKRQAEPNKDEGQVEKNTVSIKRERAGSPVEVNKQK